MEPTPRQVGHIKSQHAVSREILHRLEIAQDNRNLTREECWLKGELKKHCLMLASLERIIARLRSRIRHLKEGDANTALFHRQAGFRKQKNFVPKLLRDDQWSPHKKINRRSCLIILMVY